MCCVMSMGFGRYPGEGADRADAENAGQRFHHQAVKLVVDKMASRPNPKGGLTQDLRCGVPRRAFPAVVHRARKSPAESSMEGPCRGRGLSCASP